MYDLLDDIAKHLVSKTVAQAIAKDIFKDYMPDDQTSSVIIAINEYAGTGNAVFTDMSVRSIQVVTRSKVIADARHKCWLIFKELCPDSLQITIEGRHMITKSRCTPMKLSVDSKGRVSYFFNMAVTTNNDK